MGKQKIVILGAGLAGLSAAWHLKKKGSVISVFERQPEVGGLCRSKKVSGFSFDCDGHLLHFKYRYTFNLVNKLLSGNLSEHKRSAWVYSHGVNIPYPFQANLRGLPPKVIKECLLGLIETSSRGKAKNKSRINFQQWIDLSFGRGISRYFMSPYNRKFWTMPPSRLNCQWLEGFIPVPSLAQVLEGAIAENKREFGYNARFWYPEKGAIEQLPLAFSSGLGDIRTATPAAGIDLKNRRVVDCRGNAESYDRLISTLPLPELPRLIKGMPSEVKRLFTKLRWNSLVNVNLGLSRRNSSGKHWVYFPQKEVSFFRAGFYHNFSSTAAPAGKGALYAEVSYSPERPPDKKGIAGRVEEDLRRAGILDPGDQIEAADINDIKYAYPIYDADYSRARAGIIRYLCRHRVFPCGRYGSWRYFSMEDSILDGRRAAAEASDV